MKNRFKSIFFASLFSMIFALAFVSTTFANVSVSCAAVCRLTCVFTITGSGSDAQIELKKQQCCSQAFSNTPGINNVPCGNLE
ncbi:MAG TPA: hypothetical protein PKE69_19235 [Pyrinomonadaceae bacterium]|nr:hypothetical protein [Pyrinomonadaceae bacterium]